MPKRKVPNKQSDRREIGPEDEAVVNIGSRIKNGRPIVWTIKGGCLNEGGSSSGLGLGLLANRGIDILFFFDRILVRFCVTGHMSAMESSATLDLSRTFEYLGSICTYPLLIPLTSLTAISTASKSR